MTDTIQEIESVGTCFFNATGFMLHPQGDTLYIKALISSFDSVSRNHYTRSEIILYNMTSKVMTMGATDVMSNHLARTTLILLDKWFRNNIS